MIDYDKYWIDKAKFLNSICGYDGETRFIEGVNYAVNVARSCQTSGLVKVVLCQDCTHFNKCENSFFGYCKEHNKLMFIEDYCSKGMKERGDH